MFVYSSGKVINFCSNKCEKNQFKLKRKPLNVRWTEAYRKDRKKDVKDVNGDKAAEPKKESQPVKKENKAQPAAQEEVSEQ